MPIRLDRDGSDKQVEADRLDVLVSINVSSTKACHPVICWSMRSWESEPRPAISDGRAEFQDRMDQKER
jgi:hypothetical protein